MRRNTRFEKFLCFSLLYFPLFFILCDISIAYEFFGWDRGAIGYEASVIYAKDNNKPVIVYFHKGEEELSEKVNNDYFSDSEVDSFIEALPKAEINPDSGEAEKALSQEYNVEAYPAIFVLMPSYSDKPQEIKPFAKDNNMTSEDFLISIKSAIIYLYNEKALESFEEKDYTNALNYLEVAREYDPERPYSYYAMGVIYHTVGIRDKDSDQLRLAEENYLKALEIDKEHEKAKEQLKILREDKLKMGIK